MINNTKTAKALKSRAKFSLCKLYLKRISEQYNKEVFDKAKNLYEDLEKNIKETDEYIYGSLWELKRKLKDFENNKYIVESFPYYIKREYQKIEDSLNEIEDCNIFINTITTEIFINQKQENFSDGHFKLINLFTKKTTAFDAMEVLGTNEDNFYQLVKRLREKLEPLGIKTEKRKYSFDPSIKIKILSQIDKTEV